MADWKTRQQALSMKMLEQGFMIEAALFQGLIKRSSLIGQIKLRIQ